MLAAATLKQQHITAFSCVQYKCMVKVAATCILRVRLAAKMPACDADAKPVQCTGASLKVTILVKKHPCCLL
jgi:hypothetical protein